MLSFANTVRGVDVRWKATAGAVGISVAASVAMAQSPSFISAPTAIGDFSFASSISPDGRYVAGDSSNSVIAAQRLFRWVPTSGNHAEFFTEYRNQKAKRVLNDGRVFWYYDLYSHVDPPGHISIWQPDTGQNITLPGPLDPLETDFLESVSPDGMYLLGYTADHRHRHPKLPFIYDISTGYFRFPLNRDTGNSFSNGAGVTLPINGARFAYGTVTGNGTVTGVNWFIPNPTPSPIGWEVFDISPRAEYMLGKIGENYYLFGDGISRVLNVPTSPFIMFDAQPKKISDDGSVVVGSAGQPLNSQPDAVVWRKGAAPAPLRSILTAAGVGVPTWFGSSLTGVSADGSSVIGNYQLGFEQPTHAFFAVLPALNDNCSTARAITYGTTISSTNGATRAGVSGTCASEGSAPDIWFSFVPLTNEVISVDTCGSTFDTTLSLYGGTCGSLGTALACNDDAIPACGDNALASRITASVFAGQTYFIRVAGYNGAFGSVRLTITAPNRPINDSCAQATDVPAGTGVVFDNRNAITDSRPPCGGTPFNDVWFKTVAPESGRMTFSTCGSTINTVMAVYDSAACSDTNMQAIACRASNSACAVVGGGNGTRITVPCTAGQTLLVRVGGQFGASGTGQFNATFACDNEIHTPYSIAVRNSGALGYYRFEDSGALTAADSIRFDPYRCGDNPGTYIGNASRVDNFQGKALSLDGSGGHVRIWGGYNVTDPGQCPALDGQATLEAWVKTTDPQAGVVLTNRSLPNEHSMTLLVGYNPVGLANTEGRAMFVSDGPGNF